MEKNIYLNSKDQFHREDGPAVICPNGTQMWYKNGNLHREDGPAVIYPNGEQHWYKNDRLHREDGPAVIRSDGEQLWYLNDDEYTEQEYYKELHRRGIITEQELFIHLI